MTMLSDDLRNSSSSIVHVTFVKQALDKVEDDVLMCVITNTLSSCISGLSENLKTLKRCFGNINKLGPKYLQQYSYIIIKLCSITKINIQMFLLMYISPPPV